MKMTTITRVSIGAAVLTLALGATARARPRSCAACARQPRHRPPHQHLRRSRLLEPVRFTPGDLYEQARDLIEQGQS